MSIRPDREVQWRETLPTGDQVSVSLVSHKESVSVVGDVNDTVCRYQWCKDLADAAQVAREWWRELPNLRGFDPDDLVEMSIPWGETLLPLTTPDEGQYF